MKQREFRQACRDEMARWARHHACRRTPLLDYTRFQQPGLQRKKLTMQQQRRGGLVMVGVGVQIAVGPSLRSLRCRCRDPANSSKRKPQFLIVSFTIRGSRSPEPAPGTDWGGEGGKRGAGHGSAMPSQSKLTFFFARHPVTGRRIGKLGDARGIKKFPRTGDAHARSPL